MTRAAAVVAMLLSWPAGVEAAQDAGAERAYLRAVARYFQMPESEVSILGHWDLPTEEIPVALFLARRAGVSAEALVALRGAGRTWTSLAASYNVGANALHVPLQGPATAGSLRGMYERFRDTPVGEWGTIPMSESDIVSLVNVRVLSDALGVAPDDIAGRTGDATSFVELYAQLLR